MIVMVSVRVCVVSALCLWGLMSDAGTVQTVLYVHTGVCACVRVVAGGRIVFVLHICTNMLNQYLR